jgi:hypothetical protein
VIFLFTLTSPAPLDRSTFKLIPLSKNPEPRLALIGARAGPRRFALSPVRVAASLKILTHSGCEFPQMCGERCRADRCKVRS